MRTQRCPICRTFFDAEASATAPFCGERCRLVDLGRWLDERYGLPDEPDESPETSETPAERNSE